MVPDGAPAWAGFRSLRVRSVEPESAEVMSIVIEPIDGEPAPPGAPGQFLTVRLRPDPEGAPVTRNYSLSGPPTAGSYRLGPDSAVLVRPDGRVSWRCDGRCADPRGALADAVAMTLGQAPIPAPLAG